MNILFYSSFNNRARDAETLMFAFKKQGHQVISLTQAEGKPINRILTENGIEALSYSPRSRNQLLLIIKHVIKLIRTCYQKDINIVYCHLESASFVGVIAQYFVPARVYLCRHHIDEAKLYDFSKSWTYKLTYRLAKQIIVVSKKAKDYMVSNEGIRPEKIVHINLAYDFSLFSQPRLDVVEAIKKEFNCKVLLITVGRLTKFKRPDLSILVLKELLQDNIDAKLILLGQGEMQESLRELIERENLKDKVALTGYVENVLEYMSAATFLLHPSVLESSCVVVKESGLIGLPVIACQGIGDFDEYLVNGENAFVVDRDNFVNEAVRAIKYSTRSSTINEITTRLRSSIFSSFSIEHLIHRYNAIHNLK